MSRKYEPDAVADTPAAASWTHALAGYDETLRSRGSTFRLTFPLDQFKRPIHDPRSTSRATALASAAWYLGVFAFAAFAVYAHVTRPTVTNLVLLPSTALPPLPLTLRTRCSSPWACTEGATPLPGATHIGPCRYEDPYNRTYACAKHAHNILDGPELDANGAEVWPDLTDTPTSAGAGRRLRRRLLNDHLWTWTRAATATQAYKSPASRCDAERVATVTSWGAEASALDLTDADPRVYAGFDPAAMARRARDPNAAVDELFAALDEDASGFLDGAELDVLGPFARIMLKLNNFGDYHEGNATFAGGFKDIEDFTGPGSTTGVIERGVVDEMRTYLAGFGYECTWCVTVDDYRNALRYVWDSMKANWNGFVANVDPLYHPWSYILSGDAFYPTTSVGVDAFPKDGRVSPAELREAFRYMLAHQTVTPWAVAQAVSAALDANPDAAESAAMQLCSADVAAGDDALGGILVETTFPPGCPYGSESCDTRLTIELGDGKANGMALRLDLEPGQRKAVQVGVTVRRERGKPDAYELRADDLFYVGKNDDRRASLRVGVKQYAEALDTSRPGTWLTVFAAVGGFASLSLSILSLGVGAIAALAERSGTACGCLGDAFGRG